jgi:hypothetical protein
MPKAEPEFPRVRQEFGVDAVNLDSRFDSHSGMRHPQKKSITRRKLFFISQAGHSASAA